RSATLPDRPDAARRKKRDGVREAEAASGGPAGPSLLRHAEQECGITDDVPAPQPGRFLNKAEDPLDPRTIHPSRRARDDSGGEIEERADAHPDVSLGSAEVRV